MTSSESYSKRRKENEMLFLLFSSPKPSWERFMSQTLSLHKTPSVGSMSSLWSLFPSTSRKENPRRSHDFVSRVSIEVIHPSISNLGTLTFMFSSLCPSLRDPFHLKNAMRQAAGKNLEREIKSGIIWLLEVGPNWRTINCSKCDAQFVLYKSSATT